MSLKVDMKVKEDTAELTKFSEKPVYYTIRLYPTEKMYEYTETLSEQNLDLIFFEYIENENGLTLKYKTNENGDIEIDTQRIDKDVNICKEYFIEEWGNGEKVKKEDLEFMFDVYNDLSEKIL